MKAKPKKTRPAAGAPDLEPSHAGVKRLYRWIAREVSAGRLAAMVARELTAAAKGLTSTLKAEYDESGMREMQAMVKRMEERSTMYGMLIAEIHRRKIDLGPIIAELRAADPVFDAVLAKANGT